MREIAILCLAGAVVAAHGAHAKYLFWLDYPGSDLYHQNEPNWFDALETAAGGSFVSQSANATVVVDVNWEDHGAMHLYADPEFLQSYDNQIRLAHGAAASQLTGTVDECNWPLQTPKQAPRSQQWARRTAPFYEDFTKGLLPESLVIGTGDKGCCNSDVSQNVAVVLDTVDGAVKPVLQLQAWNMDAPWCATMPNIPCRKIVRDAGMVSTADLFASGRYEVRAKFPQVEGLVAAMWTFHYSEHYPNDCSQYTCVCGDGGTQGCPRRQCMPSDMYTQDHCPTHGPAGAPCDNDTLCTTGYFTTSAYTCAQTHSKPDPQFLGSASFSGYETLVNHEIDIEIPANCHGTANVCSNQDGSCAGLYNTANLNNYIYTNQGGEGPSYANMCVKLTDAASGQPFDLADGQYHDYVIEWHTGNATSPGFVDFYVDDVYMGTNNAFVPTRGSRFNVAFWGASWNGQPNGWGGGAPGDGQSYAAPPALISHIKITPFNELNDIMAMATVDQPDGCAAGKAGQVCHKWTAVTLPAPLEPALASTFEVSTAQ